MRRRLLHHIELGHDEAVHTDVLLEDLRYINSFLTDHRIDYTQRAEPSFRHRAYQA